MILVFVGVVDCALVLVRVILSVVRGAALAGVSRAVARQALLVMAGAICNARVGPMVLVITRGVADWAVRAAVVRIIPIVVVAMVS